MKAPWFLGVRSGYELWFSSSSQDWACENASSELALGVELLE